MKICPSIWLSSCALILCACIAEEPLKLPNNGFVPDQLNDGWEISSPHEQGMNTEMLTQAFDKIYYPDAFLGARALIVIKNGKLVAEAYPANKNHRSELNNTQSITKSFVSMLTGIAVDRGDINSIDTPLYALYPPSFDSDANKRRLTVEHALTMTTGLAFDDSDFLNFYQNNGDSASFVLNKALLHSPGSKFNYSDGPPQLIAKALEVSTEQPLTDYADQHLFSPLGIETYHWETAKDGLPFGAFGLFLTPRDLAKFGQLLVSNGSWNGTQIVSSEWISRATAIDPELSGGGGQYFGFGLWLNPANGSFAARGNGGQFVYVVPDKELVIVYTSSPSISDYLNDEQDLINSVINSTY